MNGGALNNLIKQALEKRVGAGGVAKALEDYGGDIAEKGADSFLNRLFYKGDRFPEMMFGHAIDSDVLMNKVLNGDNHLINPSFFVTRPDMSGLPPNAYGDVIFTGNKSLIDPAVSNVKAYDRHAWTGRVPHIKQLDDGKKYMFKGDDNIGEATRKSLGDYVKESRERHLNEGLMFNQPSALGAGAARELRSLADIARNDSGVINNSRVWTQENTLRSLADRTDMFYDDILADYNRFKSTGKSNMINKVNHTGLGRKSSDLVSEAEVRKLFDLLDEGVSSYKEVKYQEPLDIRKFDTAYVPTDLKGEYFDDNWVMNKDLYNKLSDLGIRVVPYRGGSPGMVDRGIKHINAPIHYNKYTEPGMSEPLKLFLYENKGKNRFTSPYLLGSTGLAGTGLYGLLTGNDQDQQMI